MGKRVIILSWCLYLLAGMPLVSAQQAEEGTKPTINVTSMGKANAKADLAIVFLSVRSSAPLAADALEQNNKKVQDVRTRLAALGYKDEQVKWSGNRFAPAGGGVFYPGGQRPTGFDVYNNVFVHLEGPELADLTKLNAKVCSLLDELSKMGASPSQMAISRMSMGGTSVVAFTVRDPTPYEKQAYQQAIDKARPISDEITRRMKAQITGIHAVVSSDSPRPMMYGPGDPSEEIPYEYVSSSVEEVPIRVRVDVRYAYKPAT